MTLRNELIPYVDFDPNVIESDFKSDLEEDFHNHEDSDDNISAISVNEINDRVESTTKEETKDTIEASKIRSCDDTFIIYVCIIMVFFIIVGCIIYFA